MLVRSNRFHGYHSLDHVYRRGATVRAPYCALRYVVNSRRQHYRLAVVVSKKVHKSAVVRNRIRRRIYEIVRLHQPTANLDIVITVYDAVAAELPAAKLRATIIKLLSALPK